MFIINLICKVFPSQILPITTLPLFSNIIILKSVYSIHKLYSTIGIPSVPHLFTMQLRMICSFSSEFQRWIGNSLFCLHFRIPPYPRDEADCCLVLTRENSSKWKSSFIRSYVLFLSFPKLLCSANVATAHTRGSINWRKTCYFSHIV